MFDPVDFFYLARQLHYSPVPPEPASIRSTISRAYYAAFLVARDNSGVNSEGPDGHKRVEAFFRKKKQTLLANNLRDLKELRQYADYDLSKNLTTRETGNALRLANKILVALGISITPISSKKP